MAHIMRPSPTIWIAPAPGNQPVRLDEVRIDIDVSGFVARTRMELVFHNPNDRILEGEFVFPLAPGQQVAGYALEVEGRMREGVVVPKQTARVAFEDTIRQQIDPGLAELVQGEVFRTRLYPIPARGHKRIALRFEQVLDDRGKHYRYVLPLHFEQVVPKFAVKAQAGLSEQAPTLEGASPDESMRFDRAGEVWQARFEREDVQPRRELAFLVPKTASTNLLLAADAVDPALRSVVALIDSGRPDAMPQLPAPARIALFYDASASARQRDRERELTVLHRYLSGLRRSEVDLIVFRDRAEPARRFAVRNGRADELLAAMRAAPLDGGSSYGAIDAILARDAHLILVVGDGLSNFGTIEPHLPETGLPLTHVLHAAQQTDSGRLQRLAMAGGGQVHDLRHLEIEPVVAALRQSSWRLQSVQTEGGQCDQISPSLASAVGRHVLVTARCRDAKALLLNFVGGDGEVVTRRLSLESATLARGEQAASVHRLWAHAQIAAIEASAAPDEARLLELATRHAVVTRLTSLLVLDRIEDYVRYRIEPYEADLRERYREALAREAKPDAEPSHAARIERVLGLWHEFRDWHQKRHPWLESVLLATAQQEHQGWQWLAQRSSDDATDAESVRQREHQAQQALTLAQALLDRWPEEGAHAESRLRWERQASELMLTIDTLRRQRLLLSPANEHQQANIAHAAPSDSQSLDRIEVTGSRVASEASAPPPSPPPPPPPPGGVANDSALSSRQAAATAADPAAEAAPEPEPLALSARIELAGWNPDAPYLSRIRAASDAYAAYLQERDEHGNAPAFYLDVADYLRDQAKQPDLALRVLSNLAEIGFENTALVRVLAYRLSQWQHGDLAVGQFEIARRQRPEEPQSHRDLALALARLPDDAGVERAAQLLWDVVLGDWSARFPEIELIAAHELNALVAEHRQLLTPVLERLRVPEPLLAPVEIGLRVVLAWDADNTDIDLWVIDPAGERTYYSHNRSSTGGRISRDFTQGYGPEVFTITRPLPGTYRVQTHYFGDRRQSVTGPVVLQLEFHTGYGTAGAQRQVVTRRLESSRDVIDIGEFTITPND